jgi:tetraacyldisaccharide 4'-kinase
MLRNRLEACLSRLWYAHTLGYWSLIPLSWLYCAVIRIRRWLYHAGLLRTFSLGLPVVVVGNIVAGGSGKTPLLVELARSLRRTGLRVGILCRGYRGRASHWPQAVTPESDPLQVGDEAVLLAKHTAMPVMAGADRVAAGRALLAQHTCDVLLCDDGLQHYRLHRDIEIAVVDASSGFGNRHCLPAGPLREPLQRLTAVQAVVGFGGVVEQGTACVAVGLQQQAFNLVQPDSCTELSEFKGAQVHAVAGIAKPERFFHALRGAGLDVVVHPFADHHAFTAADLEFGDQRPVLMTEKDAVKCARFARPYWWCVPLRVELDPELEAWLISAISRTE